MWNFLRALARATYDEIWDPVKGRYNYFNRDSEQLFTEKPKILRNEPWDPNRISDWTIDRVRTMSFVWQICSMFFGR